MEKEIIKMENLEQLNVLRRELRNMIKKTELRIAQLDDPTKLCASCDGECTVCQGTCSACQGTCAACQSTKVV